MAFCILILISIFFMVMKPIEGVNFKNHHEDYKNYIKYVVHYIQSNIKLNEIQNLELVQDSNNIIRIKEACNIYKSMQFFKSVYSYIISILNFKYTEILKKFLDDIDIILHKCKQFQDKNLSENFISCVTLLVEEVKNSKIMFENLYNAMKFLSYIDVRYLFRGSIVTNVIIDEIDFFLQYVLQKISETKNLDLNSLPNLKDCETDFKNLNEFYTEALGKVNNLFQNSNIIITYTKTDWTTIQIKEFSNENDSYLVYLICSKLNLFYNQTIEIWYKNIGFEQFLNPNIPELIPPIINQNDAVEALNILLQETGWKSMNHITIIYNNKHFSVDYIIKDTINNINFQIKKEHVIQLLRCRYTEVIKNYNVLISAIMVLCNAESKPLNYNCLIKFFNVFNKSKLMLKGLYTALITLNKSSIWTVNFSSQSSLHKILEWVSGFLCLLKNNEFSQVNLKNNEIENIKIVEKLLNSIQCFRVKLNDELHSDMIHIKTRCLIKVPFYDKFKKIRDFMKSANMLKNTCPQSINQSYLNACNYFENFCENVYQSCYEILGFRKVDCDNKSLDDKLIPFIVN
ncbi:uncharacterized protein LOC126893901 [Daktulosphaira vitifoliae]|uniref:uncharacterized protein LOC126893901 n=1 Tax=Daktulosphaira vitifoliae TaxID=58002 RepID=UPI0021A9A79D|nr:uncharacterized protein LOC126893901 [Daktulosphaira vitifoliae]